MNVDDFHSMRHFFKITQYQHVPRQKKENNNGRYWHTYHGNKKEKLAVAQRI